LASDKIVKIELLMRSKLWVKFSICNWYHII